MNEAHSPTPARSLIDTGQMPAILGGPEAPARPPPTGPDYEGIQHSAEFEKLRKRLRRFVFPVSVLFFLWYMSYVVLAAYAHDFMSIDLLGEINVGIVLGVLQFLSTLVITVIYTRYAKRRIDPQVELIRRQAGANKQ